MNIKFLVITVQNGKQMLSKLQKLTPLTQIPLSLQNHWQVI